MANVSFRVEEKLVTGTNRQILRRQEVEKRWIHMWSMVEKMMGDQETDHLICISCLYSCATQWVDLRKVPTKHKFNAMTETYLLNFICYSICNCIWMCVCILLLRPRDVSEILLPSCTVAFYTLICPQAGERRWGEEELQLKQIKYDLFAHLEWQLLCISIERGRTLAHAFPGGSASLTSATERRRHSNTGDYLRLGVLRLTIVLDSFIYINTQ